MFLITHCISEQLSVKVTFFTSTNTLRSNTMTTMTDRKEESQPSTDGGYTQREWDRVVGIGKVPEEYARKIDSYEEKQRRYDRG